MIIPAKAKVVIIGGGVSGCSVAYHLGKLGWEDVILLERKQLTSGTTWHAAGLIGQLRNSQNMTRLAKYSADLYTRLESETGISTGIKQNGSITVALTEERKEEIFRQAALARAFNVEAHEIGPDEILKKYPHLNMEGVLAGVFLPLDGQADPANIALALAKGARNSGVKIYENVLVNEIKVHNNRVSEVEYRHQKGEISTIETDIVINCGGMWARDLAEKNGITIPLHACEHFYVVTEPINELSQLPVLRVPDECAYYKEDAGKLMLGAFEKKAKPWGVKGIPDDFEFDQLPEDLDHFAPILEMGVNRIPLLEKAGIHTFFNGPESFTPDNRYYLGEVPNCSGYWVAAGYNSIGIVSSGGAGMALAQWINDGVPPFDLWEVDIRRAEPFQRNKRYLRSRVSESLGLLYADHFPYLQMETGRNIRRSPFHNKLKSLGAVFGEVSGFERPNWFAEKGQDPNYQYSWKKQNWFSNQEKEHLAVRKNIGIFDLSSFGKILVQGGSACTYLQNLCAGDVGVDVGKIVYTQILNARGGIESDLTVSRLGNDKFLLVVPCATLQRDLDTLRKNIKISDSVVITNISSSEAVLGVMGPNSRKLLSEISPNDFSNLEHPFGFWRDIEIGSGLARAHRVSYVGELGWELYVSSDQAEHVFETILSQKERFNFQLCGMHTLDSCRIEKAYRHFGHDITDEDHVLEAGLGFAVRLSKKDFVGRDAVKEKKEKGFSRYLLQFLIKDTTAMLYHNEPILRNNEIVGYVTSGNYGHYLGGAVGLGYVSCENIPIADLTKFDYEIDIAGTKYSATASTLPMYDPKSERIKM